MFKFLSSWRKPQRKNTKKPWHYKPTKEYIEFKQKASEQKAKNEITKEELKAKVLAIEEKELELRERSLEAKTSKIEHDVQYWKAKIEDDFGDDDDEVYDEEPQGLSSDDDLPKQLFSKILEGAMSKDSQAQVSTPPPPTLPMVAVAKGEAVASFPPWLVNTAREYWTKTKAPKKIKEAYIKNMITTNGGSEADVIDVLNLINE